MGGNTNEYPLSDINNLLILLFFCLNKLRANGIAIIQLIIDDKKA